MSAIMELTGSQTTFEDGWPTAPQVYTAAMDLRELYSIDAARITISDPGYRPRAMGMVRDGQLTGEPADVDHASTTVGLNGLHTSWPAIATFAQRLSLELGHPITGNAYRTPPRARGYNPHWDTHHVFLAQVTGVKHWSLFEPVCASPDDERNWVSVGITDEQMAHFKDDEPDKRVSLAAGQVLYIPRGWVHFGHTTDEQSLHVTLGAHLTDRVWLLQELLNLARRNIALRRELPPRLGHADFDELVDDCALALMEWLATEDGRDAVLSLTRRAQQRAATPQ